MNTQHPQAILETLSDRDLAILRSLQAHRMLTTRLIQRLHFGHGHATGSAATRATSRVMSRLEERGLVSKIRQRVGGVRQGSAGLAFHLGPRGEALLRSIDGGTRKRYVEPSLAFITHTLAVAELAVRLNEAATAGRFELTRLETEPNCWRSFLGRGGTPEWLKPDLYAVTANGDFEDDWFIEADLASEHLPAILRKAHVYQRYANTGAHQAEHEVFPAVIWVVPDAFRREAIQTELVKERSLVPELFRVITVADFDNYIADGHDSHGPPPGSPPPGPDIPSSTPTHPERRYP